MKFILQPCRYPSGYNTDERVYQWMMHWKEFGRKELWPHWGHSICMKSLKERISPNRLCSNQDLKSCIMICFYNKSQRDALFLKFIFDKEFYMFRTDLLSIIRSLNTVYAAKGICHASYVDCFLVRSRGNILTSLTPDDEQ